MERKIDIICLLTHARGLRILQASVPSIRLLGYSRPPLTALDIFTYMITLLQASMIHTFHTILYN